MTRNPISTLTRHEQREMLSAILAGVSTVPAVYIIDCNPIRFVTLQPRTHQEAPAIRDITDVIDGIMGGSTTRKHKDFDFAGEFRSLMGLDINFYPAS